MIRDKKLHEVCHLQIRHFACAPVAGLTALLFSRRLMPSHTLRCGHSCSRSRSHGGRMRSGASGARREPRRRCRVCGATREAACDAAAKQVGRAAAGVAVGGVWARHKVVV